MTYFYYKTRFLFFFIIIFLFFSPVLVSNGLQTVWEKVDQVFPVEISYDQNKTSLIVDVKVQSGYYVYHSSIQLASNLKTESLVLPKGTSYVDEYFGNQIVFFDDFKLYLPIGQKQDLKQLIYIDFSLQGCEKNGVCLPPRERRFLWVQDIQSFISAQDQSVLVQEKNQTFSPFRKIDASVVLGVLFLGFLMIVNPCVFPVLGALFLFIVGNQKANRGYSFLLLLSYFLGLMLSYFLLTFLVFYFAQFLQIYFQSLLIKTLLVVFLLLCAFWVLKGFSLPFSSSWQNVVHEKLIGLRLNYVRAFLLGFFNLLFISSCSAPLLAGVLAQVGTLGTLSIQTFLLFSFVFALGAISPLFLIAFLGQKLMPKSGAYLLLFKRLMGYALLVLAVWNASSVVHESFLAFFWLFLVAFFVVDIFIFVFKNMQTKFIPICLSYVLIVLLNVYFLNHGLINFGFLKYSNSDAIKVVDEKSELDGILHSEKLPKLVILYADWCISCLKEKRFFLENQKVKEYAKQVVFVFFDMTKMQNEHVRFLQENNLVGPPAFLLFDQFGQVYPVSFLPISVDNDQKLDEIYQQIKKLFSDA